MTNIKYLKNKLIALVLALVFVLAALAGCGSGNGTDTSSDVSVNSSAEESSDVSSEVSSESSEVSEDSSEVSEESSEDVSEESSEDVSEESSEDVSEESSEDVSDESSKEESKPGFDDTSWEDKSWAKGWKPSPFDYGYPTPENIEDNIFWDSLVYTGYNIQKHIDDGLMWEYILAGYKGDYGWLSEIGYAGGSLGYETTEEGLPDIEFFNNHGLVCASYIAYVYFNYIPNVVGINVDCLEKPEIAYSAQEWYKACLKWVEDGYSRTIDFKATKVGGYTKFEPAEEIPIGSIICMRNIDNEKIYCRHVAIYAGYKNGYHWVYHVGNDNGPEFCAMERMSFGEGAQWPFAIFATPEFILEQM